MNATARSIHETINKILTPIENVFAAFSGLCTMIAMVLSTLDALMRYAFNTPLQFQFYFTSRYLLVALIMLALPWGFRTGGYIRITLVTEGMSARLRNPLLRVGLLISAIYVGILFMTSGGYFLKAYTENLVYIEEVNWPIDLSWIWLPLGLGVLVLRLLLITFGPDSELHVAHDVEEEI